MFSNTFPEADHTLVPLLICAFLLATGAPLRSQVADLVFRNAKIYTVDESFSQAEAIAVKGDKILYVGSEQGLTAHLAQTTQVFDLAGKTIVPGLTDSHYHFMGVGHREFHLNLDGSRSLQELLDQVKKTAATRNPGEWVTGRGWMEEDWPTKAFPTRHDLDTIAPENPVLLTRADGHAVVVNTKALALAGITGKTKNPQGGEILLDKKTGEPTGMLIDRAMRLVTKHLPSDTSAAQLRAYAKKANDLALAYGITQVHDMGASWSTIDLWKQMYRDGELRLRMHAYVRGPGKDTERLLKSGVEIGLFNHHLTVRGIKISQDGALGSRGAALLEKYSDEDTKGLLIYKDEEIYPTIREATRTGVQMAIHAIGDAANRNILDLFERAFKEIPADERRIESPRYRIEHAQIVHPDDMPRFARLGVLPSMQASHAIGDLHFAVRRLGTERMAEGYAWRTLIDMGNIIPGGSDAPVEEGNPMIEYYAAAVRKDTTGFSAEGWHPELRMTREEALRSLTIWPAHAVFEEKLRGSIEVGKLADLTVLDGDPVTMAEPELFRISAVMTVVGGRIVYQKEGAGKGGNTL